MTQQRSLRERLMLRNGYAQEQNTQQEITIPVNGRIDEVTERRIQDLALRARAGDIAARDALYSSFRPRLNRIGYMLSPQPNTPIMVGIWDRGDVRQETWVIFTELLLAWNGETRFVSYLLGRIRFRIRDRILRGIGKPQSQFGETRISEARLTDMLTSDESDQPESAAVAKDLLEKLIRQHMMGGISAGNLEARLETAYSAPEKSLKSPDRTLATEGSDDMAKTA